MISLSYQTICIGAVVILIVGIIIGASSSGSKETVKEKPSRRVWVEFSEDELKELRKPKQDDDPELTPDFIKQKLTRDISLKDILFDEDEDSKRTRRKNRGN